MAVNVITSFIPIVDANGVPYTSARVFVCTVGTTTLKTVYSDSGLASPASNPISVSAGRHAIRFLAAGTYKIQTEINGTATIGSGTTLPNYSWDNIDPGVPVGSGALPVASGGTGATAAAGARANLSVPSASEMSTAQSDIATLQTRMGTTDRTRPASGTTAQRPGSPAAGDFRWNSTIGQSEEHDGSTWYPQLTEKQIATQAEQETGTSTTKVVSPGRQQYHPGMAKAWAMIAINAGTPAIGASYNIASITDNGLGDVTLTFSTPMSGTNYCAIAQFYGINSSAQAGPAANVKSQTASAARVQVLVATSSSDTTSIAQDLNFMFVAYGDQ